MSSGSQGRCLQQNKRKEPQATTWEASEKPQGNPWGFLLEVHRLIERNGG